ncbi:MAG: hypoxanthine phosphoribosyltransferase [Fusobacteriota bacterium]
MDYTVSELISEKKVQEKVKELGEKITSDYKGDTPLIVVGLLRGSVVFMSDLMREIDLPLKIDFMTVSSYGDSMESSREVKILKDLEETIYNKNVLIVEDIIDTGYTLNKVIHLLEDREPNSIKICTLLNKEERREVTVKTDYVGFEIPDEFVVGYGIDYAQKNRNLPYIGIVNKED